MADSERWRWTETDPLGQPVHCGQAEWRHVLARHRELAPYEAMVRAAIRYPQAIYDDLEGTERLANPAGMVVDYMVPAPAEDRFIGHWLKVSVKWLPDGPGGGTVGYVQTAYFLPGPKYRVQLRWRRSA